MGREKLDAIGLLRGHSPRLRLSPGAPAYTLFPWFSLITTNVRSSVDLSIHLFHEFAHVGFLEEGFAYLYQSLDTLAKTLLAIVHEQGGRDPHGFKKIAFDIWEKLNIIDRHGAVLEEAMAFFPLLLDESVQVLQMIDEHLREEFPFLKGTQEGLFILALISYISRVKELRNRHGKAMRGLEKLLCEWRIRPNDCRELLRAANAILLEKERLVSMSPSTFERWHESKNKRLFVSRDAKFDFLVKNPKRFAQFLSKHLPHPCPIFSTPTELVEAFSIPKEYKDVVTKMLNDYAFLPSLPEWMAKWRPSMDRLKKAHLPLHIFREDKQPDFFLVAVNPSLLRLNLKMDECKFFDACAFHAAMELCKTFFIYGGPPKQLSFQSIKNLFKYLYVIVTAFCHVCADKRWELILAYQRFRWFERRNPPKAREFLEQFIELSSEVHSDPLIEDLRRSAIKDLKKEYY